MEPQALGLMSAMEEEEEEDGEGKELVATVPAGLGDRGVYPGYKAAQVLDNRGEVVCGVTALLSLVVPRAEVVFDTDVAGRRFCPTSADAFTGPLSGHKLRGAGYYVAAIELAGPAAGVLRAHSVVSIHDRTFRYEAGRYYSVPQLRSECAHSVGCIGPGLYFFLSALHAFNYLTPGFAGLTSVSVAVTKGSVPARLQLAAVAVHPGSVVMLRGEGATPAVVQSVDLYQAGLVVRRLAMSELGAAVVATISEASLRCATCDLCQDLLTDEGPETSLLCRCALHPTCFRTYAQLGVCPSCGTPTARGGAGGGAAARGDDRPFYVSMADVDEALLQQ